MSDIEKELLKATKIKKDQFGKDPQKYFAAIIRASMKVHKDVFDALSDEAADWINNGVEAMNKKDEIDNFPDAEEVEEADSVEETEDEGTADDDSPASDDDADAPVATENADDAELVESDAEDEPEPVKPKGKGKGKPAKPEKVVKAKPEKPAKAKKPEKAPSRYSEITGEKDKFGVIKGTKTHDAVMLYEKGATAKQISEETGGRFYNILTKLTKAGHKVEKLDGGVWKLTHKDEVVKKKGK